MIIFTLLYVRSYVLSPHSHVPLAQAHLLEFDQSVLFLGVV